MTPLERPHHGPKYARPPKGAWFTRAQRRQRCAKLLGTVSLIKDSQIEPTSVFSLSPHNFRKWTCHALVPLRVLIYAA